MGKRLFYKYHKEALTMNAGCEPVYFGDESKKIIHGDALTELKKLPSTSVDLIFADPPYNIGKDFDGLVESWDEETFLAWLFECIDECHRILTPQGTMYIMNSTENMPYIDLKCRQLFTIKSRIVWSYDSSGVQAKNFFGSMYEPILMMVKDSKSYTFNRDDVLVEAKTGAKRALIDYRKNPPQPYNHQKVPGNVWDFPRVRYLMDEYENHPTQKPQALLERIILASSNPGEIVLDPFAGSFTTGATAVALNRRFIGIEVNDEYVKMGLRRLSISSHFSENDLAKVKKRKTKNLSKKSRLAEKNNVISTK
jgi:adenine-specific DNA-methyltransferase